MPIYLDYSASAPIDSRVLQRMIDIYQTTPGNADSRTHLFGTSAKEVVESARRCLSEILNITPAEIIFTSGATESNNMAILGMINYAKSSGKTHFITTAIEHKAVLEPIKHLETLGFTVDYIYPDSSGRIDSEELLNKVTDNTALVSVMHVNNETGIIQPVKEIGEELSKREVYFHIDAAQSFGKLNEELRNIKYDMLSLSAHKIAGPQGIGALVLRRKKYKRPPINSLLFGGQQEFGFRPGTSPVALIGGFSKAAEIAESERQLYFTNCNAIKDSLLSSLQNVSFTINGSPEYCLPSIINISFENADAELIFSVLKDSYAFSNGSACNSGTHSISYVLKAMGISEKMIHNSIRISWNHSTSVDFSSLANCISLL